MSKILKSELEVDDGCCINRFYLENADIAEYFKASFLMRVKEQYYIADLYTRGRVLCLATPDKNVTETLADMLKKIIESTNVM